MDVNEASAVLRAATRETIHKRSIWYLIQGLLLVVALALLTMLSGRTARHDIMVDGYKRTVAMKAFATLEVRDTHGNYAGKIKRGLGRPQVVDLAEGHSISTSVR